MTDLASNTADRLRPVVLVTGGSRGIGAALALRFAKSGHQVALVARGKSDLALAVASIESRTGCKPLPIVADVCLPDAPEEIIKQLSTTGYYIDILVNNAGLGLSGPFLRHTAREIETLIQLNIASLTRFSHAVLPHMIDRRRGGILNVASLGAYTPGPRQAIYYASKAYVLSLTEALAYEYAGHGLRIAALAPGPVATRFHKDMHADTARYRTLLPSPSPDRTANSAYWRFMLGQRVIVPGLLPSVLQIALKVMPHVVTTPIVAWLLDNPKNMDQKNAD